MAEIYFVEDEPDIARAVKEYLEQKGFGVRSEERRVGKEC